MLMLTVVLVILVILILLVFMLFMVLLGITYSFAPIPQWARARSTSGSDRVISVMQVCVIYVYMYVYIYMYVCIYIYIYTYTSVYLLIYLSIYLSLSLVLSVGAVLMDYLKYIYIYIYIYIFKGFLVCSTISWHIGGISCTLKDFLVSYYFPVYHRIPLPRTFVHSTLGRPGRAFLSGSLCVWGFGPSTISLALSQIGNPKDDSLIRMETSTYKGFHSTFAALVSYEGVFVRVRVPHQFVTFTKPNLHLSSMIAGGGVSLCGPYIHPAAAANRDLRRGLSPRGWFQTTGLCLKQRNKQHWCNADTICNNMSFETTPFGTAPKASRKPKSCFNAC